MTTTQSARKVLIRHAATCALVAALLVGVSAPPVEATFEGTNGRIFFERGYNIYSIGQNGGAKKLVAKSGAFGGMKLDDVSVSPNGKKIALSTGGGIWAGKVGGGATKVTRNVPKRLNLSGYQYPAWSPDGKKLVFQVLKEEGSIFYATLYRINADGTGLKRLLKFSEGHFGSYFTYPDWSSTNKIAYSASDDLWVMNADGTNKTNLTDDTKDYFKPSWSPDGSEIAVEHEVDDDDRPGRGIAVVSAADGSVLRSVTGNSPSGAIYNSPTWSPDGQWIAFDGYLNDDDNLYTHDILKVSSDADVGPLDTIVADDLDASVPGGADVYDPAWGVAP